MTRNAAAGNLDFFKIKFFFYLFFKISFSELTECKSCQGKPCNCWGEWAPWSPCDGPCGGGKRTRESQNICDEGAEPKIEEEECEEIRKYSIFEGLFSLLNSSLHPWRVVRMDRMRRRTWRVRSKIPRARLLLPTRR